MAGTPKYMVVVSWLRGRIGEGTFAPGCRLPSEKELSARFGLSRQTVRHALDILENEGYIRRARGSGTFVAGGEGAPRGRTMNVGIVSTYLDDYIFPSIIRGIESVLTDHGYAIQFALTHNRIRSEARALRSMLDMGVDGLIVEPTKSGLPSGNLELYRGLESAGVPVVFFNARHPALPFPCVALDDEAAGHAAARCLLEAGHRRIGGLFLLDDRQGHLRYLGTIKAMAEAGADLQDENIVWYATEELPGMWEQPGRLLARLGGCTAVVCYNDQQAVRLMEALRRRGLRVPEDISVVGVDNCDMSALCDPPLTTVAHPHRALGEAAAHALMAIIGGGKSGDVLFPPRLVARGSVAPIA